MENIKAWNFSFLLVPNIQVFPSVKEKAEALLIDFFGGVERKIECR